MLAFGVWSATLHTIPRNLYTVHPRPGLTAAVYNNNTNILHKGIPYTIDIIYTT